MSQRDSPSHVFALLLPGAMSSCAGSAAVRRGAVPPTLCEADAIAHAEEFVLSSSPQRGGWLVAFCYDPKRFTRSPD